MRRFTLCKDALRVKVFKNNDKFFDYHSQSTEELLQINNDIRGGDTKILYKLENEDVILLAPEEEVPKSAIKLCSIINEFYAGNPEGKWKVLAAGSGGLAIPPGEEKEVEHGDCVWLGLAQSFNVYQWRETDSWDKTKAIPKEFYEAFRRGSYFKSKSLEVRKTEPIPVQEKYKKKKFDTDYQAVPKVLYQYPRFRVVLSDAFKKGCLTELTFSQEGKNTEYKIGSGEGVDVKLDSSTGIDAHHATLKRIDEFSLSKLPSAVYTKVQNMLKFASNIRLKDTVFKLENQGQYGAIIERKQPFIVEPNTMELFQFGNLLVQISRY